MPVEVKLPLPLQRFTGGRETVRVEGAATLEELPRALDAAYPGILSRLTDQETGEMLPYVHYIINGKSFRPGAEILLKDGDRITIIPAIAGG